MLVFLYIKIGLTLYLQVTVLKKITNPLYKYYFRFFKKNHKTLVQILVECKKIGFIRRKNKKIHKKGLLCLLKETEFLSRHMCLNKLLE